MDREAMAELLMQLIAIDTENPPGNNLDRCAELLAGVVPNATIDGPVLRGSLGDGPETIYFHGHFDVVPAQSREQFTPRRGDGQIMGRGAADMKGGLVSMLYGAKAAYERGALEGKRIVFHFVGDEETGSANGGAYLQSQGLIDKTAKAMLTAEPTGGAVWNSARGAITMKATVRGVEAHVGQLARGLNAFERMLDLARPLSELSRELLAQDSMLLVGGQTGAGANFNVVPGSAWFSIDRRFNPSEDLDTEVKRLTDLLDGAEVEILQAQPSAVTPADDPVADTLRAAVKEIEGDEPIFALCPGVLEIRWYAQLGIPAFAYGAGRLDVSHGPHEYIDEAAMLRCAEVYARFAATV